MNPIPKPWFVNVELTLKCNLRCLHCGATAGSPRKDELQTKEWISVMEQLADLGCREVCLLGGEPFLMPGWFDIAKAIEVLGMDIVFISNGWLIDSALVNQLQQLKTLSRLGISLDGASAEVHDSIRGRRGSFERAFRALTSLRDAGFEAGAITAVSKLNLAELLAMRDLLAGQNISWQIQAVGGHGQRWSDEWNLTPEQHYQVAEFIARSREAFGVDTLPVAGSHDFGYFSSRLKGYTEMPVWKGCAAGLATLGICSSGQIKPCLSQPDPRIIGNIMKESLKTIWKDDHRFYRNRKFHLQMLKGFCRDCPHAYQCRGGCPNLPLAVTGSDTDNPFCCYRLEKLEKVPPNPLEKGWINLENLPPYKIPHGDLPPA